MAEPAAETRQVLIERIYVKDASLEVPLGAEVFTRSATPAIDVQVGTGINKLTDEHWQILLSITVTAKVENDVAFLCEVHQAGIFRVVGFSQGPELQGLLAVYCPNVIFPFAREAVASFIQHAGFPPVMLQPIDFNALYAEHLRSQAQGSGAAPAAKGDGPRIIV
jgi:preprotein translocase subunit SecB